MHDVDIAVCVLWYILLYFAHHHLRDEKKMLLA